MTGKSHGLQRGSPLLPVEALLLLAANEGPALCLTLLKEGQTHLHNASHLLVKIIAKNFMLASYWVVLADTEKQCHARKYDAI